MEYLYLGTPISRTYKKRDLTDPRRGAGILIPDQNIQRKFLKESITFSQAAVGLVDLSKSVESGDYQSTDPLRLM